MQTGIVEGKCWRRKNCSPLWMCIVYLTCPDKLLEKEISLVFEFGWHDIIKKLKTFYLSIGPLRGFLKYFLFKELSYDKESISCISFLVKKENIFPMFFLVQFCCTWTVTSLAEVMRVTKHFWERRWTEGPQFVFLQAKLGFCYYTSGFC